MSFSDPYEGISEVSGSTQTLPDGMIEWDERGQTVRVRHLILAVRPEPHYLLPVSRLERISYISRMQRRTDYGFGVCASFAVSTLLTILTTSMNSRQSAVAYGFLSFFSLAAGASGILLAQRKSDGETVAEEVLRIKAEGLKLPIGRRVDP
jgi:hypothetical protein